MKFMFLIYHEEKTLDTLPDGEMQSLVDAALGYTDELRQSGHFIVSNALRSAVLLTLIQTPERLHAPEFKAELVRLVTSYLTPEPPTPASGPAPG